MKSIKRFTLSAMGVAILLLMTGCVSVDKTTGQPTGFIWDTIGAPMAEAIKYFANEKGLGFGIGIIIVTIIVRLIILPLGIYQSWKSTLHSEKMNALKHVLEPHQTRLKEAETQEEKLAAQQALFAAQKEHGISMLGGVGCFPILLQMPFFSAIFFAAQHTEGVADSSFLGIALGSPSMLLVAFAGILYYLQSLLSLHGVEDEMQREQLKKMIYMSPLMIVMFSLFSPASVTLYWVVGGFMMIFQQFIINYVVRPKLRQKVREEYAKNPPKATTTAGARKDVTPQQPTAITTKKKQKKRNSGKQRSR
ncbi:membrane protein insertase YidC [Falseniella ignava]